MSQQQQQESSPQDVALAMQRARLATMSMLLRSSQYSAVEPFAVSSATSLTTSKGTEGVSTKKHASKSLLDREAALRCGEEELRCGQAKLQTAAHRLLEEKSKWKHRLETTERECDRKLQAMRDSLAMREADVQRAQDELQKHQAELDLQTKKLESLAKLLTEEHVRLDAREAAMRKAELLLEANAVSLRRDPFLVQ